MLSPRRRTAAALALLLIALLLGGCQERFDREAMLQSLSAHVIVPTYASFAARADTLAARAETLRARPTRQALAQAAEAWRTASTTWKETEAFELGPVRAQRINSRVNFWPTRPETIEKALASQDTLDAEAIERLSVAARGLPALEYLLFDTTGTASAALLEETPRAARQRTLAAALARDVAANAQALLAAWRPGGEEHFAATWGQGDGPMDGPQEAISMLTNRMVFLLEEIRHDKLGAPLGKANGGTPQPRAAEAWRSGTSRAQIRHNLAGLSHVYHGRLDSAQHQAPAVADSIPPLGLADYVQTVDAGLADSLRLQIEATQQAVRAIPAPLHEAVTESPAAVERAYEEVGTLLRLTEVDLMNELGVTLMFNDNDGD